MLRKIGLLVLMLIGLQTVTAQISNNVDKASYFKMDKDVSEKPILTMATYDNKFLSKNFTTATINDELTVASLRFNLLNNQMEYAKDGGVFHMKKSTGTRVFFKSLNVTYECFDLNGSLTFLEVYDANDQNSLRVATKQSVSFIPAESAVGGGYRSDRPAKYIRKRDEYYFILNNTVTEVPRGKKDFFNFFNTRAKEIKEFMKSERLNRKKLEDIQKVVEFFNNSDDIE